MIIKSTIDGKLSLEQLKNNFQTVFELFFREMFYEAKQVLRSIRDGVVRVVDLGCILRFHW